MIVSHHPAAPALHRPFAGLATPAAWVLRCLAPVLLASTTVHAQGLQCPETPFLRTGFEPASGPPVPATFGERAALDLMNCARRQVDPPATPALAPLAWSATLAAAAQVRADACSMQFDPSNGLGQFFVTGFGGANALPNAVNLVLAQRSQYDYASNTCLGGGTLCRNYTQVVFRNATATGCAVAACGVTWCFFDSIQFDTRPY